MVSDVVLVGWLSGHHTPGATVESNQHLAPSACWWSRDRRIGRESEGDLPLHFLARFQISELDAENQGAFRNRRCGLDMDRMRRNLICVEMTF